MKGLFVTIRNEATGSLVCRYGRLAGTFFSRLTGLLGRRHFAEGFGDGLLIRPASSVHTIGMSFPIDVVALDKNGLVVAVCPHLRPYSIAFFNFRAEDILELPAGQIHQAAVAVGDRLSIRSNHDVVH